MTPRQTFGSLITREREAKGMTRVALATAAGISREALRRIEAGESGANERTVAGLVKVLALHDTTEVMELADPRSAGWERTKSRRGRWWLNDDTGESMPEARAVARALAGR